MKKTLLAAIAGFAAVFVSCTKASDSPDKSANAEYVKAALMALQAKDDLLKFDIDKALSGFTDVSNLLNSIPQKYPESDIALKLVSDRSISLGPFRVEEVDAKVIPALKAAQGKQMEPLRRTFLVASLSKNPDEALKAFAESLLKTPDISAEVKNGILKSLPVVTDSVPKAPGVPQAQKVSESKSKKTAHSQSAYKEMLKDALKASRFTDLDKAQQLLKISEEIDAAHSGEFAKILESAIKRASTISIVSLREKSYSMLAAAAANIGDNALALDTIAKIKGQGALDEVFPALAATLGSTDKYPATLSVISKIADVGKRDALTFELVCNMAKKGNRTAAIGICSQIKDKAKRNRALCKVAAAAYEGKDSKNFISAVSKLDVSSLECLDEFVGYADVPIDARNGSDLLANLAKMTLPQNRNIAMLLTKKADEKFDEKSKGASLIIDNYTKLAQYDAAKDFIARQSLSNAFTLEVKISLKGAESGNKDEAENLRNLAKKASSLDAKKRVSIALDIEVSGIDESLKSETISNLLVF